MAVFRIALTEDERRAVTVDGRARDLRRVLASPDLAPLVSDEGPITAPGY